MARGAQLPCWWRVVEQVEGLVDARAAHRADGVLTRSEDGCERRLVAGVLRAAVDAADSLSIAQAVARGGPESGHARRLLAARARRLAGG